MNTLFTQYWDFQFLADCVTVALVYNEGWRSTMKDTVALVYPSAFRRLTYNDVEEDNDHNSLNNSNVHLNSLIFFCIVNYCFML